MCLIDFGIAKEIINTNEGKMITGLAYTTWFRDPQYSENDYNSIKVEIYPLGKMIYNLYFPEDHPQISSRRNMLTIHSWR